MSHPAKAIFDNRVSKILGTRFPIIQAPMGWIARSSLASAVSNAGGMGMIETSSGDSLALVEELKAMQDKTEKPFGVNLAQLFIRDPGIVDILVRHDVKFVTTSAGDPSKYVEPLKAAGIKVFHVVPNLESALKAVEAGVDGLIAEGSEGAGFKSDRDIGTFVLLPLICAKVDIPLIAAGGVTDGCSMAAAFLLGAEGVQIGTRILATTEAPIHENYKNAILNAQATDTIMLPRSTEFKTPAMRVFSTSTTEALRKNGASPAIFSRIKELYFSGDMNASIAMMGQGAGKVKNLLSVQDLFMQMVDDFELASSRLYNQYISRVS